MLFNILDLVYITWRRSWNSPKADMARLASGRYATNVTQTSVNSVTGDVEMKCNKNDCFI